MATTNDPFHEGERALQERTGAREQAAGLARAIRDFMPDAHRAFFERLPFVVIGSLDAAGQPHASAVAGRPGFLHSADPRSLTVSARPHAADPLAAALAPGASLGLLGIEPHTRRRNRLNGVVSEAHPGRFTVAVQQSYGNCPKYIQARRAHWLEPAPSAAALGASRHSPQLDDAAHRLIGAADTFFIASAHPLARTHAAAAHGVDVSHRGGKPGFVRVDRGADGRDRLTVPDFSGNSMFNTLGNLALEPRAGLLFIDYERGDVLQLAVEAEIVWQGRELQAFEGAERLLRMHVREQLRIEAALPLAWTAPELSPFVLETGAWPAAHDPRACG